MSETASGATVAPDFTYSPPDVPLSVIYADDQILIVDKPAGLLSVPGRGEDRTDCLINRLRVEYPSVLLCHRLDLDTSGVMVFALSKEAQSSIARQFQARETKKIYLARVWGEMATLKGQVDLPLIVDWPNRPKQHVNHETGKPAKTKWRRLEVGGGETRVRLLPVTGRSHQLRVHMAEIGHPILGDALYAQGEARAHPRMMLHAYGLRLQHPVSGETMDFTAPCPF